MRRVRVMRASVRRRSRAAWFGASHARRLRRLLDGLLLVVTLALLTIPVFQAAHALTHVDATAAIWADNGPDAVTEADGGDLDVDKICLDCLALTAFSAVLATLTLFLPDQARRLQLPQPERERIPRKFLAPYLTRAPPPA